MECCRRATQDDKENKRIDAELKKDRKEAVKSVLLLGPGESGKSTLFKQMKIIQYLDAGYTVEELQLFIPMIRWNAVTQMQQLLKAGLRLNLFQGPLVNRAQNFTQIPDSSWSLDVAQSIRSFWADASIQKVYTMRDAEFHLNETANYFFENVMRLAEDNYIPTEADVLRARTRTTGIEEAKFSFDDLTLKVTDVGGQRGERRKWIHCFQDVHAILYVAALSEYDQVLIEEPTKNRMKESLELFRNICESRHLRNVAIILFLNKEDLFDAKIQVSPLNRIFPNYEGTRYKNLVS
jgi:GTPase SAR1 family protein